MSKVREKDLNVPPPQSKVALCKLTFEDLRASEKHWGLSCFVFRIVNGFCWRRSYVLTHFKSGHLQINLPLQRLQYLWLNTKFKTSKWIIHTYLQTYQVGCKYSNKCLEIAKIIVLTCKRNNPTTIHLEHKNWNVKEDNIKEAISTVQAYASSVTKNKQRKDDSFTQKKQHVTTTLLLLATVQFQMRQQNRILLQELYFAVPRWH